MADSWCRCSFGYRDVVEVGERLGITEDDRERIAPASECPSGNYIKLSRPEICDSGAEFAVPLNAKKVGVFIVPFGLYQTVIA